MRWLTYLKDKALFVFLQFSSWVFLYFVLKLYHVNSYIITLVIVSVVFANILWLVFDFITRFRYYKRLEDHLKQLDKKQLIADILEKPFFLDAEILYDVIKETTKAMNDEIESYSIAQDEYREYIETWIHEVKTPISCIDLICKNNHSDVTRKIEEEIRRIDGYVEQALFYARSTDVASDYRIKKIELSNVVKRTIKKHSQQLIRSNVQLKLNLDDFHVYSDEKWLDFIIGQIISNSIKYKRDGLKLSFIASEQPDKVILSIKDTGIGIPESDVPKIFEKGFTGKNGREFAKSTGIGLYLCKKLCEKMYLGLEVYSAENEGTTVEIIFPKDRQILFN